MQSFDIHRPALEGRSQNHGSSKFVQTMSMLICFLLFFRLWLVLSISEAEYEQRHMMEALARAMRARTDSAPQYRLIPSEMIPGMPPGQLVRVRVTPGTGGHAWGGSAGQPFAGDDGGPVMMMRGIPMHDPTAFQGTMPVQDPSSEAHFALARMMAQNDHFDNEHMQQSMQSILQSMADGAGDHGQTGGLDRADTPDLLTISAHLPGHHMLAQKQSFDAREAVADHDGKAEVNPLDVKLLERTLLIRGTMRKPMPGMGEGVYVSSSFQRAVWLPANALTGKIQCEYGRQSGNLVIKIPKDSTRSEKDDLDEDHPVQDAQRVEKIRASFQNFQRRVRAMQQSQSAEPLPGVRGGPHAVHGVSYDDLKQRLQDMHDEGNGIHLEDASPHLNAISKESVEYLGCFKAWDLPRAKRQLPAHAASSFARTVVAAARDAQDVNVDGGAGKQEGEEEDQFFFAMARHDAPHKSGAAFTFRRFDHAIDTRHEVQCGNHCDDDGTWFCGALGDAEHHSSHVDPGVESAVFAVYALKNPKDISHRALEAAQASDEAAEQDDHPQWRLIDDFNMDSGGSKVELIVPKQSQSLTQGENKVVRFFDEAETETATVILPMVINPTDCSFGAVTTEQSGRVVTCTLGSDDFRVISVQVKDEL